MGRKAADDFLSMSDSPLSALDTVLGFRPICRFASIEDNFEQQRDTNCFAQHLQ